MYYTSKEEWLSDFRQFAEETLRLVMRSPKSKSDKAKEINKQIKNYRDTKLNHLKQLAGSEHWSNETLLTEIMCLTYVSYIVMLEYRNKVWPYEYMAFARRIGELWEPFCKLASEINTTQRTSRNPRHL